MIIIITIIIACRPRVNGACGILLVAGKLDQPMYYYFSDAGQRQMNEPICLLR